MRSEMDTVKRAAALLDRARPGWHNEIDTERLNLMSMQDCVLGQAYGSFTAGFYALCDFDRPEMHAASELRYTAWVDHFDNTHKWLQEIAERRWVQQELIEEKDVDMEKVPA